MIKILDCLIAQWKVNDVPTNLTEILKNLNFNDKFQIFNEFLVHPLYF